MFEFNGREGWKNTHQNFPKYGLFPCSSLTQLPKVSECHPLWITDLSYYEASHFPDRSQSLWDCITAPLPILSSYITVIANHTGLPRSKRPCLSHLKTCTCGWHWPPGLSKEVLSYNNSGLMQMSSFPHLRFTLDFYFLHSTYQYLNIIFVFLSISVQFPSRLVPGSRGHSCYVHLYHYKHIINTC